MPTPHSAQLVSVGSALYRPGAHAVQVDAPTPAPVLVIDPAGQLWHWVGSVARVYRPAAQCSHVNPTAALPTNTEPGLQAEQSVGSLAPGSVV